MRRTFRRQRRGAAAIEFALCCPIVLFFCFSTIIGGLGVFRYQQTAELAREAARWASVHGGQYAIETGNPAATADDIYTNAIAPMAATLQLNRLSYQVTWDRNNMPVTMTDATNTAVGNKVSVTVTYQWFPELFFVGPYNLTSTSTSQMVY